jgi:hypothetical protein
MDVENDLQKPPTFFYYPNIDPTFMHETQG